MSEKAYEDACVRAELFGQPLPDKEQFLANHKHLDVVEFEDVEIKTGENSAMLDEALKGATAGIGELTNILASTGEKITQLKGVCGSVTNFFRGKLTSNKDMSYSSDPTYVGQTNYDDDGAPTSSSAQEGCTVEGLSLDDNETKSNMSPPPDEIGGGASQIAKQDGGDINAALQDLEGMQKEDGSLLKSSVKDSVKEVGNLVKSQMSKLDRLFTQNKGEPSTETENKPVR